MFGSCWKLPKTVQSEAKMGRPIKHSDPFLWALASENNSKWPVKRRMVSSSLYILLGPTPHEELLEHLLDAQKKKHSSTCCWPRLSGSPVQEEGDGNGSSRRKNCKFNKEMAHCYNYDEYGNFPKECRSKKNVLKMNQACSDWARKWCLSAW